MSKISDELNYNYDKKTASNALNELVKTFSDMKIDLTHTKQLVIEPLAKHNDIMKNVNHPSHYQTNNGIEVIDVIEAFSLDFNLGNVVKYVLRCGKKDTSIQELEKAKWYLEREINNLKKV